MFRFALDLLSSVKPIISQRRRTNSLMFVADFDDSDIKIAPDNFGDFNKSNVLADTDSNKYFLHKQNGNLVKAHEIALELADIACLCKCPREMSNYEFVNFQVHSLTCFSIETIIETFSPDSIIAKSSKSAFYDEIKAKQPIIYDFIINSGSYSMYMLCQNNTQSPKLCVAQAFAKSCQNPNDEFFIELGEKIYGDITSLAKEKYSKIDFKKI